MTSDIQRRILEHYSRLVKSTKNRRPLEVIYFETFQSKSEARSFEKKLNDRKGKNNIQILKDDSDYRLSLISQT